MSEEQTNPLERGSVGTGGNTVVTNFAYINVTIGDVQLTNLPLDNTNTSVDGNGKEYEITHHALHDSGFNSFIKSFSCKRQVPKKVTGNKGFWQSSGGATECNLTIFDPTFVQFENLIMDSVKNQKVHCKINYGISRGGGGKQPPPFEMHCFINEANEHITNSGVEWSLKMSPVPSEWFDDYPESSSGQKETVFVLSKNKEGKTKYSKISDLVAYLLEQEGWSGVVINTTDFSKTKEQKFPTKDYSSRVDFINRKLAPLAKCADEEYASSLYSLVYQLDGSVFFMPVPMTIKKALQLLEDNKATAFGNYKAQKETILEMDKETIESMNMQEYMSEDNGALILKYGFKNSIVQEMSINFDSKSFISQFYFNFEYNDEESNKIKTFQFPEIPKDKNKQDKNAKVINKRIHLYATNENDAMQEAQMIARKLHITNYQGSATLVNWPYIGVCQIVKFEYLIPGGSKQSKTNPNINKADANIFITDNKDPNDKSIVVVHSEAYNNCIEKYGMGYFSKRSARKNGSKQNNDQIEPWANMSEKQKWQSIVDSEEYKKELQNIHLKYKSTPIQGNLDNSDVKNDSQFNSNIGIPSTLSSWTDSHKSSVGYYVQSITDTIKGGLLISQLELIGWIKYDYPQLDAALKE